MPLTVTDRNLIIAMIGDCDVNARPVNDSTGVIATNIVAVEAQYEGRPINLQKLYTHRDCIDLVLARLKDQANTQLGNLQVSKSQRARTLLQMRASIVSRLVALERRIRATGGNIGLIETVAPVDEEDAYQFVLDIV